MNFGPLIFLGIFFAMSLSWLGLVLGPQMQLGNQTPEPNEKTGMLYPQARSGTGHQGAEIYRANGCFYCHSQQVGPKNFGSDYQRGWGSRRTVAADYLFESPVMAGSQRVGPDFANIGARQTDENFLFAHIYNPQSTLPAGAKSNMPRYPYLFEKRRISGKISASAIKFPAGYTSENGFEIIPRREALLLVSYLKSLQSETPLFEIPSLTPSTNTVASTNAVAGTNAPADTNAPAATNAAQPATTNVPAK
ncbi:MAG: cbb3-type cytochrome c oxidase subunit II [Verrucomicrobiota bacterium]